MKGRILKKLTALAVCSFLAIGVVACTTSNNANKQPEGNGGLPAQDSWHEERSGYTFCGYYADKDFTSPVTQTVTQAQAHKYYPKYQLDKVQQMACAPTDYQQVIYAPDFRSAWTIYLRDVYGVYDIFSVSRMIGYDTYGIPYSNFEVIVNDVAEKLYTMKDNSQTVPYDYRNIMIPHYMEYGRRVYNYETEQYEQKLYTRNNTWRAYISSNLEDTTNIEQVVYDGWVYDIIDNSFAVVYGLASGGNATSVDSLTIPAKIGKYPVKEVSILNEPNGQLYFPEEVGTLTIPSSVENVVLYGLYTANQIQNLVLEEGIKTLRMEAHAAKSVSLPKSVYYADFNTLQNRNNPQYYYTEQSISVAENGHYYTKDGCLYSKEGDLVFQFANRDKFDLKIDGTAKRVLPLSVVGGNKNIYIPENMEYFDWFAFLFGARGRWITGDISDLSTQPMLLIDSPKVVERMLDDVFYDIEYNRFMPMLVNKKIDMEPLVLQHWSNLEKVLKEAYDQPPDGSATWEEFSNKIRPQIIERITDHIEEEYEGEKITVYVVQGYQALTFLGEGQLCVEVDNVVYRSCSYQYDTNTYQIIAYSYMNATDSTDYSELEVRDPILMQYYNNQK